MSAPFLARNELTGDSRKINIWIGPLIAAPAFGPMFGAFMLITQKWPVPFWVYTAMVGLCLVLVIAFVDETYYDRRLRPDQQPPRKSRLLRLIGVEQWRSRHLRNTFGQALMRPVKVILKPTVFLSVFFNFLTFSWLVGINTTLAIFLTPLYHFGLLQVGYFYWTPIVGCVLGAIASHWVHDLLARHYIKHHHGHFEPEARLRGIWVATPFMVSGLILFGFCLQDGYHYMVTSVAWALYIFGIEITTVALNSYVLDSYPEASGEAAAWLLFGRTTCGFIISYFQIPWALAEGTKRTFGIQGGLTGSALILVLILQVYGKRMRIWSGKLNFHTM